MAVSSARDSMTFESTTKYLYPTAFAFFILVTWQVVVGMFEVSQWVLPGPLAIVESIRLDQPVYVEAVVVSSIYIIGSFVLGSILGIILAVIASLSEIMERVLQPFVLIAFVVPKIVLAPLFLLWFGSGPLYFTLIPAIMVFFPVLENTLEGLKGVPAALEDLSRLTQSTTVFRFRHVYVPYSLPHVMAGLKVGIKQAVVGVIIAEFIAPEQGIGQLLIIGSQFGQPLVTWGGVVIVMTLGILLYGIVEFSDRKLIFWETGSGTI